MPERSLLTNIRIMVHTLSSAILQRISNPWNLSSDHPMHTSSNATMNEVQQLMNELQDIHQMSQRLGIQAERSLALLSPGKTVSYSSY